MAIVVLQKRKVLQEGSEWDWVWQYDWAGPAAEMPDAPAAGSTYYTTDTLVPYVYGSGWVEDTRRGSGGSSDPASAIHAADAKATPDDADELGYLTSVGGAYTLVKMTWAQREAALKAYFDTLYLAPTGDGSGLSGIVFSNFPTPSDSSYNGLVFTATAGETLAFKDTVYWKAADSRVWKAKGDVTATMNCVGVVVVGGNVGESVTILYLGKIRDDAAYAAWTDGGKVYQSAASAGLLTQTAPSTEGYIVQSLGRARFDGAAKVLFVDVNDVEVEIGPEVVDLDTAQSLTNKTVKDRIVNLPNDDATLTSGNAEYDIDNADLFILTNPAQDVDFGVPGGTPYNGQRIKIVIVPNAARNLTWNAWFRPIGVTLPSLTVNAKIIVVGGIYLTAISALAVLGVTEEV